MTHRSGNQVGDPGTDPGYALLKDDGHQAGWGVQDAPAYRGGCVVSEHPVDVPDEESSVRHHSGFGCLNEIKASAEERCSRNLETRTSPRP